MTSAMLNTAARYLPAEVFARLHVWGKLGYWPNLRQPRTFAERLQAKKLWDHDPLISSSADKYLMRQLVIDELGPGYLPELYGVVEDASDVDVSGLPSAYVMKGAHGSGWNRLVTNSDLTNEEARAMAADWLSRSFYWKRREWAYLPLTPRVIFEENLAPGQELDDYKLFTFDGEPRLVQVDRDRFTDHSRALYDPKWRELAVMYDYPHPTATVAPPARLPEMLEVARQLGRHFGFARIDLYAMPDRVVVGEITHYPDGGVARFVPRDFDRELGAMWGEGRALDEAYLAP